MLEHVALRSACLGRPQDAVHVEVCSGRSPATHERATSLLNGGGEDFERLIQSLSLVCNLELPPPEFRDPIHCNGASCRCRAPPEPGECRVREEVPESLSRLLHG